MEIKYPNVNSKMDVTHKTDTDRDETDLKEKIRREIYSHPNFNYAFIVFLPFCSEIIFLFSRFTLNISTNIIKLHKTVSVTFYCNAGESRG